MESQIHLFESAGLGAAPFKVVGIAEIPSLALAEANPEAYNRAIADLPRGFVVGSCAFCGHSLRINFLILSADGKSFAVGSECVRKAGDAGMIDRVKAESRIRARKIREQKRSVAQAARLHEQRERNDGLTDSEMREKAQAETKARESARLASVAKILSPIAERLEDGRGGFCDSMARDMKEGTLPHGRGWDLVTDILGKQAGRRGSNAYHEAKCEANDILEKAQKIVS